MVYQAVELSNKLFFTPLHSKTFQLKMIQQATVIPE